MSVFNLAKGKSGIISDVKVDGAAGERLNALGIKKGAMVTVVAFSLFNSGVLIMAGYNRIGLRKYVAERIEVTAC